MTSLRKIVLGLVVVAAAGCVELADMALPDAPYTLPNRVGPGAQSVSASQAVALFNSICGASAPTFANARATMESSGQFYSAPSGTYYHTRLNALFKVYPTPGNWHCSMVFRSPDGAGTVTAAFARLRVSGSNVFLQTATGGTYHAIAQSVGM